MNFRKLLGKSNKFRKFRSIIFPEVTCQVKKIPEGGDDMLADRQRYLNQLIKKQWNGRIKVICGIRRSGNYVKPEIM